MCKANQTEVEATKVIVKLEAVTHQGDILIVNLYAPNITLKIYKRKIESMTRSILDVQL